MNVKKCHQSEICVVINDKSEGSIGKYLRCDWLLDYTLQYIIQSADERIFEMVNIWRSYRQNSCFMRPIHLALLPSNMLISPDKLNNLCITDRNCY